MVMTQKQVGFVAMLAMVAILLTVATTPRVPGISGVPRNVVGVATAPPVVERGPAEQSGESSFYCTDSDGDNPYAAGMTSIRSSTGAIASEHADRCSTVGSVVENTCNGKQIKQSTHTCIAGCVSGRCLV